MPSGGNAQSPRIRKLFCVADEIGLTRSERIDLAQFVLRRDVRSWAELDETQASRILDSLEGFQLVSQLLEMRPPSISEAS